MGSDVLLPPLSVHLASFNPRSHMGSDLKVLHPRYLILVSIHAPTWGATSITSVERASGKFQSTLPHGERRLEVYCHEPAEIVSIHAPTWGATVHSLQISFTMSYNTIFAKEANVIIIMSLFPHFNL